MVEASFSNRFSTCVHPEVVVAKNLRDDLFRPSTDKRLETTFSFLSFPETCLKRDNKMDCCFFCRDDDSSSKAVSESLSSSSPPWTPPTRRLRIGDSDGSMCIPDIFSDTLVFSSTFSNSHHSQELQPSNTNAKL